MDIATLRDIKMQVDAELEQWAAEVDAEMMEPDLLAQLALRASTAGPEVWAALDRLHPGAKEAILSKFGGA